MPALLCSRSATHACLFRQVHSFGAQRKSDVIVVFCSGVASRTNWRSRMPSSQLVRTLPSHARYAKLSAELPPEPKRTPSMLAAELKGASRPAAALRRPRVIGLLNMSEFTHNTDSIVPLEEPLFQPSPPEVVFDAFECHEKYSMLLRFVTMTM